MKLAQNIHRHWNVFQENSREIRIWDTSAKMCMCISFQVIHWWNAHYDNAGMYKKWTERDDYLLSHICLVRNTKRIKVCDAWLNVKLFLYVWWNRKVYINIRFSPLVWALWQKNSYITCNIIAPLFLFNLCICFMIFILCCEHITKWI